MADDLTQKLGFEATQALTTLSKLSQSLNKLKQGLTNVAKTSRKFDSQTRPMRAALVNIRKEAERAAAALKQVSGTRVTTTTGGGQGAAVGAQVAASANKGSAAMARLDASVKQTTQTIVSGANKTKAPLKKTKDNLNKVGAAGKDTEKSLLLSWTTIGRILGAQFVIRGLNAIVQGMRDVITESIEFNQAIGEISTIADESVFSVDQLTAGVLRLSSELGKTPADVAAGLYQTISNQVVKAGEEFEFLSQAEKLAIVTTAETKDAVDALSSVINSYSLSAKDAAHVSNTLFKTVELGRIRLKEIGGILGRVTPLTAAMGVSWEESAAALVVMTRKGVQANTALTQLRAIMQKLIKPTDKMKELFEKWDVRDAEEAVAKFGGLAGILKELAKESGNNNAEMATYFSRVRAIVAQLSLMQDGGKELVEVTDQITNSTDAAAKAWEKYTDLPGYIIVQQMQDLKNALIEAGLVALPLFVEMAKWLNTAVKAGAAVVKVFLSMADAMGVFKQNLSAVLLIATAVLVPVAPWLALGTAIAAVVNEIVKWYAIYEKSLEDTGKNLEGYAKKAAEIEANIKKWREQRVEDEKKALEEDERNRSKYVNKISSLYKSLGDNITATQLGYAASNDSVLDEVLTAYENHYDSLKNLVDTHENTVKDSLQRIAKIQSAIDKNELSSAMRGKTERQKLFLLDAAARKKEWKARSAFNKAGLSEEKLAHARRLFDAAVSARSEAKNAAVKSKNRASIYGQEQATQSLLKTRLKSEGDIARKQSGVVAAAEKQLAVQERGKLILEAQIKLIKKRGKELAKTTDPLSQKRIKKDIDILLKEMLNTAKKFKLPSPWAKLMGEEKDIEKLKTQLETTLGDIHINWSMALDELQVAMAKRKWDITLETGIQQSQFAGAKKILGLERDATIPDLAEATAKAEGLKQKFNGIQSELDEINRSLKTAKGTLERSSKALGTDKFLSSVRQQAAERMARIAGIKDEAELEKLAVSAMTEKNKAAYKLTQELQTQNEFMAKGGTLSADLLASNDKRLKDIVASGEVAKQTEADLQAIVTATKELAAGGEAKELLTVEAAKIDMATINRYLGQVNTQGKIFKDTMAETARANGRLMTATAGVATNTRQSAANARIIADQTVRSVNAINTLNRMGAGASNRANGGVIYRAEGGGVRGTDTVPAMLSPGEVVMNPQASRQWYSQLTAMNAGIQPQYKAAGGDTTTVGDINISITESVSAERTARETATAIQRELRRQTVKL